MQKMYLLLLASLLLLSACREDTSDPPKTAPSSYFFQDGFESANHTLAALFVADGSRWTSIQQVNPNNGDNEISLTDTTATEGSNSLQLIAKPSDAILSKMDIEKADFFAPVGSTVIIEADIKIPGTDNLKELFLLDLECCSCWDPTVPDNQCPSIRLKISGDDNYLSIERGKILGSTLSQTTLTFPRDEWVRLRWQMRLAPDEEGESSLFLNGQELIKERGKNMPNPSEFTNEFANNGIDFQLQEPLGYERLQIGATANPTPHEVVILIDDFSLSIE